jgi:hypothetical protein
MAPSAELAFAEAAKYVRVGLQRLKVESEEAEKLRTEADACSNRESTQQSEITKLQDEVAALKEARAGAIDEALKKQSLSNCAEFDSKVETEITRRTQAIVDVFLQKIISDEEFAASQPLRLGDTIDYHVSDAGVLIVRATPVRSDVPPPPLSIVDRPQTYAAKQLLRLRCIGRGPSGGPRRATTVRRILQSVLDTSDLLLGHVAHDAILSEKIGMQRQVPAANELPALLTSARISRQTRALPYDNSVKQPSQETQKAAAQPVAAAAVSGGGAVEKIKKQRKASDMAGGEAEGQPGGAPAAKREKPTRPAVVVSFQVVGPRIGTQANVLRNAQQVVLVLSAKYTLTMFQQKKLAEAQQVIAAMVAVAAGPN